MDILKLQSNEPVYSNTTGRVYVCMYVSKLSHLLCTSYMSKTKPSAEIVWICPCIASLTLARQTVYATARNLTCQWLREEQCAWGCVAYALGDTGANFVPAMPRNWRAKSCHISGTRMWPWHLHDRWFTPWHAIWRANEGLNRDSVRGCVGMRLARARPWRGLQNVHLTARIGTPCHSVVAPTVCSYFRPTNYSQSGTKVAWQFRRDK